jgi:hypothetical protein
MKDMLNISTLLVYGEDENLGLLPLSSVISLIPCENLAAVVETGTPS